MHSSYNKEIDKVVSATVILLSLSFKLTCLHFSLLCFRNLIQPEQCSYSFTPSRVDITLKKRHSQRWGGLEAPATQGLLPSFYLLTLCSKRCLIVNVWCKIYCCDFAIKSLSITNISLYAYVDYGSHGSAPW